MKHTYSIVGMTCASCQAKVQQILSGVSGVENVSVDLQKGEAIIETENHIPLNEFSEALKNYPKYQISEMVQDHALQTQRPERSWIETYKPLLLIFAYIITVSLLSEFGQTGFVWERWMQNFMAGFFLVFSFFKLLNLKGFAESYSMYDIIAKKWNLWGYVYALLELGLGLAYLLKFDLLITNLVTFVVMAISIIGVLQSVMNKRKIKCACLGTVFNLPMSSVTIIEDALMILMSGAILITLLN